MNVTFDELDAFFAMYAALPGKIGLAPLAAPRSLTGVLSGFPGLVGLPDDGHTARNLPGRADSQMYEQKRGF